MKLKIFTKKKEAKLFAIKISCQKKKITKKNYKRI